MRRKIIAQFRLTRFLRFPFSPFSPFSPRPVFSPRFLRPFSPVFSDPFSPLVAISGGESTFGTNPSVQKDENAFGLMHRARGTNKWVPNNYSNSGRWAAGIAAAASTVDTQFLNGNVTVAQMFSGKMGAYCFGNCTTDESNISKFFQELGGGNPNNSIDLLWPCQDLSGL
jgi:hypothetical protein